MSNHLTPLEDMRRERDEAQARADRAEQRLSKFTRRMAWGGFAVVALIALASAGIVFAPEQAAHLLMGAP